MTNRPLRIIVFGAHPDDCDIKAGGLAINYAALGHEVRFVSMTNGDGELEPTLENRKNVIRMIRSYTPDLILTHRPNDYHPDHRYAGILVQDAAYMVTVPNVCTDVPALAYNPVIAYMSDNFRFPAPFMPEVAIDIDDIVDKKLDMLHCHTSQMYEWLPFNAGKLDEVPKSPRQRRKWLEHRLEQFRAVADRHRDILVKRYGERRGRTVRYAEAFQACEYGAALTPENTSVLFPF